MPKPEEKEYLDLDTPMTKDRQILNQNYEKAAKRIIEELEKGKDVAYLTLGDSLGTFGWSVKKKRGAKDEK
jgi:precorrin-2 methylase